MSSSEPPSEYQTNGSNLQRLAIGAGTLLVVILTVVIAIFLTIQDLPEPTPTAIAISTSTPTSTNASDQIPPTASPTNTPTEEVVVATEETAPHTATPLPEATSTPEQIAPTDTPVTVPENTSTPTNTTAPVPEVATATPISVENGSCQKPPDWIEYTAQIGDTYNSLAERTNVSVVELLEVNCPEIQTIREGDLIYLPIVPSPITETATPLPAADPSTPEVLTPEITSVTASNVPDADADFTLTIIGRNFQAQSANFKVELRGVQDVSLEVDRSGGVPSSDTNFDAIVPANLPEGSYDLVVTNINGKSGIFKNALFVGPTPTPTSTPTVTSTPTP